ncbi:hypothetical protein L1987_80721 [Smallanthus sonchifolius]|uniref:Uncharacterized protein n=1 Tax=Smallanthus sonchifolius TaxID=185202 RepID=A0ACB8YP50_9ASTR|nr:hypothetical protein L1987_80721 [Smallanthus sonchifolius]
MSISGTFVKFKGTDGLLKLWTVKTNECVATYNQHEDKVWALTLGKKTEMLATGGSDAVINLWHDSTAADKEDEINKLLNHLANISIICTDVDRVKGTRFFECPPLHDQEIYELVTSKDSFQQKRSEEEIGYVSPTELRAICEKCLLLITITIPEMDVNKIEP